MKKRIFALALALTLLAGLLAGCGGKTAASGSAAASKPAAAGSAEASPLTAKYVYTAQYIDMPAEVSNINTFALVGGKFYYAAQVADGKATYKDPISSESYDYDVYVTKLFALDLTTEQSQQLAGYTAPTVPEGEQGGANILSMAPGKDDTLWVCDQILTYKYNLPEDFNAATDDMSQYYEEDLNETRLLQLAADGTVKQEIPISGAPEETQAATAASADTYMGGNSISNIVVDDNGYIYTTDYQNVRVYDPQGKQLFSLDVSQQGGDLRRYSGTEVGVTSYDENGISFLPIDIETKTWGEPLKLPQNAYSFYPGDDAYDLYYDYNGNIYGYDKKTDTSEKVVDWLACDVDSNNLQSYQVLPDGRVAGILTDYSAAAAASGSASGNPSTQLVLLTRTEAKDAVRKTVLTLACMGLDWNLRSQIVQFNRTSDQYRIEVQDYSEYNTEKDYTAGLTKLGTEILAGKVPDMLCTNGLPVEQYAAKGILADLLPLIDADGELTRDSFNQNVMNAILTDGKLYQIPQGFYISTAAGLKKIVGGYDSWTFDSLKDAMTKLPEGASIFNVMYTKNDVLQQFVSQSLGSFVNWDTKTCTFGSPAFVSLLEFAGQFPDTFDSEHFDWQNDYQSDQSRVRAGQQLLAQAGFSTFSDFQYQLASLGDDCMFIGIPTVDGQNGSTFNLDGGLAVTSSCADPAGAWSFIRRTLTADYQSSDNMWSFPINNEAFEAKAKKAMTPVYQLDEKGQPVLDKDGNKIEQSTGGYGDEDGNTVEIYAMKQAEYDQLMQIIADTKSVASYDQNIFKIVSDEAAAYFSGEKDAQAVADLIQSRAQLYVAEQG